MNNTLFFIISITLFTLYLGIGFRASKHVQGDSDFFLMGRNLTSFSLCLTLLATQLGGGTLLGAAQEAYEKGWVVLLYPLGQSLGLIVLGLGFGRKLRQMNISTIPEIFEKAYKLEKMRTASAMISIISMYLILIAQGIAIKSFFSQLGITSPIFLFFFWAVFVAYTVMGGLKAVVDTDVLQVLFILGSLGFSLFFFQTSFSSLQETLHFQDLIQGEANWAGWFLMPFCFMFIEQDMGQRCFAAKTVKEIRPAAILAGILLMAASGFAATVAILARQQGIEVAKDDIVLVAVIEKLTNPAIASLFMATIIMAIVSTADSLLCSISANLSCDLLTSQTWSNKKKLSTARFLTFFTGVSSLAFAYYFKNIVAAIILSYELSVSVLFIPVLMAILQQKPSRTGAVWAAFAGGAGFVLFRIFEIPIVPKEVLTLLSSLAGYLIGTYVGKIRVNKEKAE